MKHDKNIDKHGFVTSENIDEDIDALSDYNVDINDIDEIYDYNVDINDINEIDDYDVDINENVDTLSDYDDNDDINLDDEINNILDVVSNTNSNKNINANEDDESHSDNMDIYMKQSVERLQNASTLDKGIVASAIRHEQGLTDIIDGWLGDEHINFVNGRLNKLRKDLYILDIHLFNVFLT